MSESKKPVPRIEESSVVPLRHVEDTGERYHRPHGRPTRMKKPTVSEIGARNERARKHGRYHYRPAASRALFIEIPYLLDLVDRRGKALGRYEHAIETAIYCEDGLDGAEGQRVIKEARALLEEAKL